MFREFLCEFWQDWKTRMSGILSVLFWAVTAFLSMFNVSVIVYIGFVIAATGGLFIAAFQVWKKAKEGAIKRESDLRTDYGLNQKRLEARVVALEEQVRQYEAERDARPRLVLFHTENHHQHQRIGNSDELMFRVGVREEKGRQLNGVLVRLRRIELEGASDVGGDATQRQLEQLTDVPLHLKHDNDRPFRQVFNLPSGGSQDIDVIGESPARDCWSVCIAITRDMPETRLSQGKYRLMIEATADNAESCERVFCVGVDRNGRITFRPE